MRSRILKRAVRSVAVLLALGLFTAFFRATGFANATTVALSFLLLVLAAATLWGLAEAIAASIGATLFFNYFFLPPVGTFTIADPQNWIALFVFLSVSIVASQLSERARRTAEEAVERQRETEHLYTLSRMILLLGGSSAHVGGEIVRQIVQILEARGAVLYETQSGEVLHGGAEKVPLSDAELKEIPLLGKVIEDPSKEVVALPVSLGGRALGSLALSGVNLSDGARQAVANLVAIALENARNREMASRAELALRNEEFKSTLLDALAHELKTPLTSARAALSALLNELSAFDPNQRELLTIADEETQRLNRLMTEILQMARIEAGTLRLDRQPCAVDVLVRDALEQVKRTMGSHEVEIHLPANLPPVSADRELLLTVLNNLLENAAKYSPPRSPISIAAQLEDDSVCIRVANEGPGLREEELTRVFERYYRSAATRDGVPGLGMGLSIARDIVVAHGGRIWAESSSGQGTRFSFTLPVATEKAPT